MLGRGRDDSARQPAADADASLVWIRGTHVKSKPANALEVWTLRLLGPWGEVVRTVVIRGTDQQKSRGVVMFGRPGVVSASEMTITPH